jgi:hypothetical protein
LLTGVAFDSELKKRSNVYKYLTLSLDSLAESVILLSLKCPFVLCELCGLFFCSLLIYEYSYKFFPFVDGFRLDGLQDANYRFDPFALDLLEKIVEFGHALFPVGQFGCKCTIRRKTTELIDYG